MSDHVMSRAVFPTAPIVGPRSAPFGASMVRWFAEAWRRRQSRAHLTGLDAQLLSDIGVSFAEAEHEANKPFWRK